MITYKLLIEPDAFSYKMKGVELFGLSIEFIISGSSRIIDTNIYTNKEIIKRSDKIKYFVVKNKIYNLKEMLALQFLAKIKYIDSVIEEVWDNYGASSSNIEVLDIVEEKLSDFAIELFDLDKSLDGILIEKFQHLEYCNSNENFQDLYNVAMLLRAFFYYQIENGILLDFSNYDVHIPKLKELCLNNWIKKEKYNELLDVLLTEIVEDYFDKIEF